MTDHGINPAATKTLANVEDSFPKLLAFSAHLGISIEKSDPLRRLSEYDELMHEVTEAAK